ncbi:hypothetical protein [Caballeronia sordidicola]|nr:hypothetical protein [Caballeronia sordidicola]
MIDQDHEGVIARTCIALCWGAVGVVLAAIQVRDAIQAIAHKLKRKSK